MKNNVIILISIAFCLLNSSCRDSMANTNILVDKTENTSIILDDIIESKVDSLIGMMTLEEKIGQMNQYNGFWNVTGPTPQKGDAAKKYEHLRKGWVGSMLNVRGVEEVKAVQKVAVEESRLGIPLIIGFDVIHGYKTMSPIPLAESASWDMDAIKKSAEIAALEASASGINWTFAPDVGTSTLNNIVFPPFKAATEVGVRSFMNSFNELNGVPATGNKMLQRDVLKNDWGFNGFIVSDWGSIKEMIAHGYAKDDKSAAEMAVNAGSDMDMESYAYVEHLTSLVKEGKVEKQIIDDAVRRILRVKYELGLFDDPYKYCNEEREKAVINSKANHQAVLDVAKKSIVLLKNENNLLPLKDEGQRIALIGALAADKNSPLGSWRIGAENHTAVSVLEGMKAYKGNTLTYAKGADVAIGNTTFVNKIKINTTNKSGFPEALKVAKNADVVVMVLGEVGFQSGEGRSRTELDLPGVQQELLQEVFKVNKNIVLVLNNGRPLAIPWADKNIPAIVEAWHLGSQSGNAIAQVLYGDYNPSGKLPMSFPRNVGQVPIYYNYKNTGRPTEPDPDVVFWSHYSDQENTPLYAFGHGLSYTTFQYDNLIVKKVNTSAENPVITVSIDITNTGDYQGKEVVQLYVRDLFASVTRPVKELKGFELVSIVPQETKTIDFKLNAETLGFYNNENEWVVEPGDFEVFVGGSSDKTITSKFKLE